MACAGSYRPEHPTSFTIARRSNLVNRSQKQVGLVSKDESREFGATWCIWVTSQSKKEFGHFQSKIEPFDYEWSPEYNSDIGVSIR